MHKQNKMGAYATKPATMTNTPLAIFLLGAQFLGFPSSPSANYTGGAEICDIITLLNALRGCGSSLVTGVSVVASEDPVSLSI
jgi:hypothetical protein